ncbi:MAG: YihY/virulence factor BrkB family protein [Arachnia sp.]
MAQPPTFRQRLRRVLEPIPGAVPLVRLVAETVRVTLTFRVTGLAAEAAFFTLLSLPPLLLGLVAGAAFVSQWLGPTTLLQIASAIEQWSLTFLTAQTVQDVIMPTLLHTLSVRRADVLSIGFLVALWSGSRVLHVLFDAVSIMYGQGGHRSILRARLMALITYVVAVLGAGVTLPLLLIGPSVLRHWLPDPLEILVTAYWPLVGLVGLASLTALYHFATPNRSPYVRDVPGAVVTVALWAGASALIRNWAVGISDSLSLFGPLTAPIILLVYLYFSMFAVLVGAATNAAIRRLWPPPEYRGPIVQASQWWDQRRQRHRRRVVMVSQEEAESAASPGDPGDGHEPAPNPTQ